MTDRNYDDIVDALDRLAVLIYKGQCDLRGELTSGVDVTYPVEIRRLLREAEKVVRERMNRPTVVCLCGSSRFFGAYQEAEYRETMAGNIYLSIGFYPHSDTHGEGVGHDSAEKIALDELHKRKIDLADEVLVLNVGGYIGDSTKSEVRYALRHKKPVRWLEPENSWNPVED